MLMEYVWLWSLLFKVCHCASKKDLILDGKKASNTRFLHSVYLNITGFNDTRKLYQRVCGASIVNQRALLTAAHCFDDNHSSTKHNFEIKVGHVNINKARSIKYSHHKIHEKYNYDTSQNDVAIVITKEDIELGKNTTRVVLMKKPPRGDAFIAGWGTEFPKKKKKNFVARLRFAQQKIIDERTCRFLIKDSIPTGTFCALPTRGYPFHGDTGSALMIRDYIQVGIKQRQKSEHYAVAIYANVSYHLKWIKKTINEIYCS